MSHADRNLLFGILAVQMNFVGRDALIAAMHAWVLERSKPLGRILVEQQALSPARHDLLEQLVAEQALALAEEKVRGENLVRKALAEGMSVAEAFRRYGVL